MIKRTSVAIVATGGAGTSTGEAITDDIVSGVVVAVHVARDTSATTGVVISEKNESPSQKVLTLVNAAASAWYYPAREVHDADDGTVITGGVLPVRVADYLNVAVTGANNNDDIAVTVVWDDGL